MFSAQICDWYAACWTMCDLRVAVLWLFVRISSSVVEKILVSRPSKPRCVTAKGAVPGQGGLLGLGHVEAGQQIAEIGDGAGQAFFQGDCGRPIELFFGKADIGAALLGIVLGQGAEIQL